MQNAVPKGEGGMVAVLGSKLMLLKKFYLKIIKTLKFKLQMIILKVK